MTTAIVLDTSVLIKWFRQREVLAENALSFRTAYLNLKFRQPVRS